MSMPAIPPSSRKARSIRATEWLNFFVSDVQAGVGPFVAVYLAASGWNPGRVGLALTLGGIVTVILQTPAGAVVDAVHRKRLVVGGGVGALALGALLLAARTGTGYVAAAQALIGAAGAFLGPAIAAITLGIVGQGAFDRQFGRNQGFNSAGNVAASLVLAGVGYQLGNRAIFLATIVLAAPAVAALAAIDSREIDYRQARASGPDANHGKVSRLSILLGDRILLAFCGATFLFHLGNAAMLPQLGEMLSKGDARFAAPVMSACVTVTQLVIAFSAAHLGRLAATKGRKGLLLLGFGVLPIRGVLYTLTHSAVLLIAIQLLDGVANAIFVVVSMLVVLDRTRGTGHFNLAQGALATMVGIGAALSNALGGELAGRFGYNVSFLALAAVAGVAFLVLWRFVPETLPGRTAGGLPPGIEPRAAEPSTLVSD
jgi:MFS family permease